nr:MAG TPA: hypothetical protein [Caudoviricetes sp.]
MWSSGRNAASAWVALRRIQKCILREVGVENSSGVAAGFY